MSATHTGGFLRPETTYQSEHNLRASTGYGTSQTSHLLRTSTSQLHQRYFSTTASYLQPTSSTLTSTTTERFLSKKQKILDGPSGTKNKAQFKKLIDKGILTQYMKKAEISTH